MDDNDNNNKIPLVELLDEIVLCTHRVEMMNLWQQQAERQ